MEMDLIDKTVLVTGSTKGIGKAIAREMVQEGANVIINGRRQIDVDQTVAELQSTVTGAKVQGIAADLASEKDREKIYATIPRLDILVNNMGIFQPMDYFEIEDQVWKHFFEVNVLAGNSLAKHYLPAMLENDFGRIIFIASEEALMPSGEMPQYSMTKTMNLSLAQSLSKLTIGTHVTVNTVMPGPTLTEGVADMLVAMYADQNMTQAEQEQAFMKDHRPLSQIQRFIRPLEIGRFVTFVASPLASAFSGEALRMDGGMIPTIF
ncbi:SDR family oxidoreductase [Weissella muntiaci]|jgi:3-oxoacyl-[acyl-carrier protein] reductase|uniref:SDR family oxidoreductase n=1 Tax=Weissella muntiaci TaxID=2508881 RepID=A0A6C2C791_9LACO|nr:SDR family oxidoreductase [Weissella muntiaci]TYC49697.1 SDR family oxidoreductase [Weissella muntiaci]